MTQQQSNQPQRKQQQKKKSSSTEISLISPVQLSKATSQQLPVHAFRRTILDTLKAHSIILISGATGSGKTTQIPQFIHAHASELTQGVTGETTKRCKYPFRMAITQPRRVAATSLAERVAWELSQSHSHGKNHDLHVKKKRKGPAHGQSESQGLTAVGGLVGYQVRFDAKVSENTAILFLTDGMLLKQILSDPLLLKYQVIVLDEAHERTVRTDILFGLIKGIVAKRNSPQSTHLPLKVVIMSATLETESFSAFFGGAPIIDIPGRQFPVSTFYTPTPMEDPVDAACLTIMQIHKDMGMSPGDILCFLTGQEEIDTVHKLLLEANTLQNHQRQLEKSSFEQESRSLLNETSVIPDSLLAMSICPLYAALPAAQQAKVFRPTKTGTRKVILATNIAETSLTISGVKCVVDTGLVKERDFHSKIGMETLKIVPISRASADQRKGRAGREGPGMCFRLFTEAAFGQLASSTVPEIQRCNLSSVILLLKATGVKNILEFDFMERPSRDAIIGSLEGLLALGALDREGRLTALGQEMSSYPVDPVFAKALIESKRRGCGREVAAIVAMLSSESIFTTPSSVEGRRAADDARKRFAHRLGDHLTLLRIWQGYSSVTEGKKARDAWCGENFLNGRALHAVGEIHDQLLSFMSLSVDKKTGDEDEMKPSDSMLSDSSSTPFTGRGFEEREEVEVAVLQSLLAAFFRNVAALGVNVSLGYKVLGSAGASSSAAGTMVHIHPSSALFQTRVPLVMYTELVHTSRYYVRGVSEIQASWLPLVAPQYFGRMV